MLNEVYTLNNGGRIPKLALGTWQISNEAVTASVEAALSVGYRHIDTAAAYENEEGVGAAIKKGSISRNDLYITTKIPAEVKSYEEAEQVISASLKKLGTNYIDLLLIHAPNPWAELFAGSEKTYYEENLAVWKAMEEAVKAGSVKSIGVSNFEITDIQNIINHAEIKPQVNQIRVHIGHVPQEVITWCRENDILVEAYSPNATGHLVGNKTIEEMAAKYNVSIPQLAIRFDLQLGTLPLPKTTHKEYMIQNSELDFEISKEDMDSLLQISEIANL